MNARSFFPRSVSLFLVGSLLAIGSVSRSAAAVPQGFIVVDVQNFATLPQSNGKAARANVLTPAPDGRLFVNDQRGFLYSISNDGQTVTSYLNVAAATPLLSDDGERGFQSFAFHPDFLTVGAAGFGKLYTVASQSDTNVTATFTPGAGASIDHHEVLLEWTTNTPGAATFVPADSAHPFREVLRIARPASNHNGGLLAFNPTAASGDADYGNLYYGTGDSGSGGDPLKLAQMPGKAYGALLRIDPLLPASDAPRRSKNGQYRIPADNPFRLHPAFLKEKYAAGFRNPQRFTWDSANGRMFLGDIGQNAHEEIDVVKPGANYGWNKREGSYTYPGGVKVAIDTVTTGFIYPIAEYAHFGSAGNAVACGPVYRGTVVPNLNGRLLFGDFPSGTPYSINADDFPLKAEREITELRLRSGGNELTFLQLIQQTAPNAGRADLRFGSDAAGEVYLLNKQDGIIRKVVASSLTEYQPDATLLLGKKVVGDGLVSTDGTGGSASASLPRKRVRVFTVRLKNAGPSDTFTLQGTGPAGRVRFNQGTEMDFTEEVLAGTYSVGPITTGAMRVFRVELTAPATPGATSTTTLTFTSESDPSKADTVKLTATAQ